MENDSVMLGFNGIVYRYLPSHVKNGLVILLCIFERTIDIIAITQISKHACQRWVMVPCSINLTGKRDNACHETTVNKLVIIPYFVWVMPFQMLGVISTDYHYIHVSPDDTNPLISSHDERNQWASFFTLRPFLFSVKNPITLSLFQLGAFHVCFC